MLKKIKDFLNFDMIALIIIPTIIPLYKYGYPWYAIPVFLIVVIVFYRIAKRKYKSRM